MRIKSIKIHNFRSIEHLELQCGPHAVLIGPNNHGKSNVLSALEFALSTAAKPTAADLFQNRPSTENSLWVELAFTELTEQERTTFSRYLDINNVFTVRKSAHFTDTDVVLSYNGYATKVEEPWLNPANAKDYTKREDINSTPLKFLVPEAGKLSKDDVTRAQQQYIDQHRDTLLPTMELEESPFLGQRNIGGGVLPDFYMVPAVKDLSDDIKFKNTTWFGRLLTRAIAEMAERDPRFAEARKQLSHVVASLNDREAGESLENELGMLERSIEEELSDWRVQVNIEVKPPDLERIFELGTVIQLHDGVKTSADRKGHGLQRAMMFAILRAWTKSLARSRSSDSSAEPTRRKSSHSVIFAIEEPELFLHPQAQRQLAQVLRDLSEVAEHQVFLCTHSTHFVSVEHYMELGIITKASAIEGSTIRQCRSDNLFTGDDGQDLKTRFRLAHWINPDRAEMFFARHTVFVEGETEKVVLPFLAKRLGVFDPGVSIIDCGSKNNLPLYISVANAFELSYSVIHDEDPLPNPTPDGWTADKIKSANKTFELNTSIAAMVDRRRGSTHILSGDFEEVAGVSKRQGTSKGKSLAALLHFEKLLAEEIPDRLEQVVRAVYATESNLVVGR